MAKKPLNKPTIPSVRVDLDASFTSGERYDVSYEYSRWKSDLRLEAACLSFYDNYLLTAFANNINNLSFYIKFKGSTNSSLLCTISRCDSAFDLNDFEQDNVIKVIFYLLRDERNLIKWLLPNADSQLFDSWKLMANSLTIDLNLHFNDLRSIFPQSIFSYINKKRLENPIPDSLVPFMVFPVKWNSICSMPRQFALPILRFLISAFPDEHEDIYLVKQEPLQGLRTYNVEAEAIAAVQIVCEMINNELIELGKNGRVTAKSVKQIANLTEGVPSMFTNNLAGEPVQIVPFMIAACLTTLLDASDSHNAFSSRRKYPIPPTDILKAALNFSSLGTHKYLSTLLPKAKFPARSFLDQTRYSVPIWKFAQWLLLGADKDKEWLDVDNVCRYRVSFMADFELVFCPFCISDYSCFDDISINDKSIDVDDLVSCAVIPAIRGMFALMAAVGMVELAIDDNMRQQDDAPPYSGIAMARLTDFGRFVLDVKKSYAAPAIKLNHDDFSVDNEHLIVTVYNPQSPFLAVLKRIAKPIPGNRYLVDASTLVSSCSNVKEVNNAIDGFKKYVCSELPPLWDSFFKEVLQRCTPLKKTDELYEIYTIDPDNDRLIDIFSSDRTMQRLTKRAEDFMVLIPINNKSAVTKRLKELGYLL